MAPSFGLVLSYYLVAIYNFGSFSFALKNLTAEFSFLIGILLLNTLFANILRSRFIKITGSLFVLSHYLLMPLLYATEDYSETQGLVIILIFTGFSSLFIEIFYLPIIGICLEVCPQGLEGFFMSMILLLNNFSKNISQFLGTLCVYFLGVTKTDFSQIYIVILINSLFGTIGVLFLIYSFIPERPKRKEEKKVTQLENTYLAYINTNDSIMMPKTEEKNQSNATDQKMMSGPAFNEIVHIQSQNLSIN